MKEKIKKILKNRILIFILGGIVFGTIGVSAATYFESNLVTYDNTESGLSSTDVQGAIDELYNFCIVSQTPASEQLIDKGDLGKDAYEDRYFFKGKNPNNYITFNGEIAGWRILSIESDGTIKIIKNKSIGEMAWNSSNTNNWANASLKTYLNGTYYNELNTEAQNQIVTKDWSIGAAVWDNNNLETQINNENSKKWSGKIGLHTASEYIRATSNSSCNSMQTYTYTCENDNWIYSNTDNYDYLWTLTPQSNSIQVLITYIYDSFGRSSPNSSNYMGIRPALYLSSDIKITGGDGSQSNPYQISL